MMKGSKFERAVLDMEAYRIYLREVHKSAITTITTTGNNTLDGWLRGARAPYKENKQKRK